MATWAVSFKVSLTGTMTVSKIILAAVSIMMSVVLKKKGKREVSLQWLPCRDVRINIIGTRPVSKHRK